MPGYEGSVQMNPKHPELQHFLEIWLAEFGRAIEMFTGQPPSLGFSMVDRVSIPKTASALWLKQVFYAESEFEIWIGAQDATWMELSKSLRDGSPDSLRSTYLEVLNQAQQRAPTFGGWPILLYLYQCQSAAPSWRSAKYCARALVQ